MHSIKTDMLKKLLAVIVVAASIADLAEATGYKGGISYKGNQKAYFKAIKKAQKNGGGGGGRPIRPYYFEPYHFETSGRQERGDGGSTVYSPSSARASSYPSIIPKIPSGAQLASQYGFVPIVDSSDPQRIQVVNEGVRTIITGVRSFDLGEILRGAFSFSRNPDVVQVANTAIDSLFATPPSGYSRN